MSDLESCVDFLQRLIRTESLPGREGDIAELMRAEMDGLGYSEVHIDEVGNDTAGFPLNVSPDPHYRYEVASVSMEPGSVLVAYTDGITDTRNQDGEWYGVERLLEVIRRAPPDAGGLGEAILEDVSSFGEGSPPKDDLTLVLVGRDVQ